MTVRELVKALAACPADAEVRTHEAAIDGTQACEVVGVRVLRLKGRHIVRLGTYPVDSDET